MEFLFSRFSIIRGIKGFRSVYEDALRYRHMITEQALERARILAFWEKHGLNTTLEAFPHTKRRTLFLWKKNFLEGGKKIDALSEKKRTPKTKRKRIWNPLILEEIRRIREEHPNLGKDKIFPSLLRFCTERNLTCPTVSTIGRLIKDMGGLRMFPKKISHFGRIVQMNRRKVLRKPKHLQAEYPGHIVSLDTVEEYHNGSRRYLITATDVYSRLSFAWATHSHASLAAKEFFSSLQRVFPFPFVSVLTDNGSEFAKHFSEEMNRLHLLHYHTYPRTPKMNAHVERFNRTIRDEFLDFHKPLLFKDIHIFNHKLLDYLLWFNTERVHFAFGNKCSPLQFIASQEKGDNPFLDGECKDGWTCTTAFLFAAYCVQ